MFSDFRDPGVKSIKMSLLMKIEKLFSSLDDLWNPFGKIHTFTNFKRDTNEILAHDILNFLDIRDCDSSVKNQCNLGFVLLKTLEFQEGNERKSLKFDTLLESIGNIDITEHCQNPKIIKKVTHSSIVSEHFVPSFSGVLALFLLSDFNSTHLYKSNISPLRKISMENLNEPINLFPKPSKQISICLKTNSRLEDNIKQKMSKADHDVLNQELVCRKKKALTKLSKKRQRRVKKRHKTQNAGDITKKSFNKLQDSSHTSTRGLTSDQLVTSNCDYEEMYILNSDNCIDSFKEVRNSEEAALQCRPPSSSSISVQLLSPDKSSQKLQVDCTSDRVQKDTLAYVNPTLAFILGNNIETESDDDQDFDETEDISAFGDLELSQFSSCFMTGFTSLQISSTLQPLCGSLYSEINVLNFCEFPDELVKINNRWNSMMAGLKSTPKESTKVSFAEDKLTEVIIIEEYDRKSNWEIYALERIRFKQRIDEVEKLLSPFLTPLHREKVYHKLLQ